MTANAIQTIHNDNVDGINGKIVSTCMKINSTGKKGQ